MLLIGVLARAENACPSDAHQCPDGSYVRRNPEADCEFDPCPQHSCPEDAKTCPDGTIVGRDAHNHCHWHPCPSVRGDVIGTDVGDLPFKRLDATKTFNVGNVNKVSAMDVDEGFIYAATYDMIIKANKLNMSCLDHVPANATTSVTKQNTLQELQKTDVKAL